MIFKTKQKNHCITNQLESMEVKLLKNLSLQVSAKIFSVNRNFLISSKL